MFVMENSDTTNGNGVNISFRGATTGGGANSFKEFGAIQTSFSEHDNATQASSMKFWTASNGVLDERMRISTDGYLGVGTGTPARKLHVAGPIRIDADSLPGTPALGDIVVDSADSKLKFYNGTGWVDLGDPGVSGTGTAGAIPKFTAAGTIGDSAITDDGSKITATRSIATVTNPIASGANIDLSTSNTHTLASLGTSTIVISNPSDGATYNIVIEDTTSRTYSFSGCTASYWKPAQGPTADGTRTIFGLMTVKKGANWDCYITWSTGFQ